MDTTTLHSLFLEATSVSTDTRKIKKGNLFFALKGDNFNGNKFANLALKQGASYAIVDEENYHEKNGRTILVTNVLESLQHLAAFHRKYTNIPIIALTGSNGKTTTKELINSVLSEKYKTIATQGNLNNHIGVPLTLLSIAEDTEVGIVEMGANHHGEIAFLCDIAQPDYGYITNFGKAHLEGFGSLEGVIKAKSELYDHLRKNNKTVFINSEDKMQVEKSQSINSYSFGGKNSSGDLIIENLSSGPELKLKFFETTINGQLTGTYNLPNIGAAIAMGVYFNVPENKIKEGIENYIPSDNRSQIITKNSNTIMMDAYNANPSSMVAALESFASLDSGSKIVFLGDMFELGEDAEMEHQNITNLAESKNFNKLYLIGENFNKVRTRNSNSIKCKSFEDFKGALEDENFEKSQILIKGSRGMALERILDLL